MERRANGELGLCCTLGGMAHGFSQAMRIGSSLFPMPCLWLGAWRPTQDAERPGLRSHAERGNEGLITEN